MSRDDEGPMLLASASVFSLDVDVTINKGKQVFKRRTWYPKEGMAKGKSKKAAVAAAARWEK